MSLSNSEDHTVLTLTLSLISSPLLSILSFYVFLLTTASFFYLQYSSLPLSPSPPSFSPLLFCLFSPLCTAPLCTAPVLPHSQGGITRQNAGSGEKRGKGGKRSGRGWRGGMKKKNWQAPPLSAGDQLQSWLPMKFNPHRIYMPSLTSGKPY